MSFSHLSSQASDSLLRIQKANITDDYVRTVELFYRLNSDVTIINSSLSLLAKTYLLLTQVNYFIHVSESFQKGHVSFDEDIVYVDLKAIRVYAGKLLTEYRDTFMNNRHQTARVISILKEQLQDLDNYLRLAPDVYGSFNEAQWSFRSLYNAINHCIVNIQNAVIYLSATLNDEDTFDTLPSHNSLYLNESAKVLCNSLYYNISQELEIIQPILSFVAEKLSQWLHENSYAIVNSTSDAISNGLNSNNVVSERIPGIWSLAVCNNGCDLVISTLHHMGWKALLKNLAETQTTTIINDCLFQYETSLNQFYESTNKVMIVEPQWNLGDPLSDFLDKLLNQTTILNNVVQSYLLGSVSLQMSLNNVVDNVKAISALIDNLKNQILTSKKAWKDEVVTWSNTIASIYTEIFVNIQSFLHFQSKKSNATALVSSMYIWKKPVIDIGDNFFLDESLSDTAVQNIVEYGGQNVTEVLLTTMENAVLPNFNYASAFIDQYNALYNELADIQINILVNVSQYSKSFLIDENFVR